MLQHALGVKVNLLHDGMNGTLVTPDAPDAPAKLRCSIMAMRRFTLV